MADYGGKDERFADSTNLPPAYQTASVCCIHGDCAAIAFRVVQVTMIYDGKREARVGIPSHRHGPNRRPRVLKCTVYLALLAR